MLNTYKTFLRNARPAQKFEEKSNGKGVES